MNNSAVLNVTDQEFVGTGQPGTFTQNGGVHTLSATSGTALTIGSFGSSGTFQLFGGTLLVPSASVSVENGLFSFGGGAAVIGGTLFLSPSANTATRDLNLIGRGTL